MPLIPGNVPQLAPARVLELANRALDRDPSINASDLRAHCPVMFLALRGYYRDTMGVPQVNDIGIFDDAGFLINGREITPYNWNTDPSRVGWNSAIGKRFAMLTPGIWPFRKGQHKQKGPAWRQITEDEATSRHLDHYFQDKREDGSFQVYRASTLEEITSGTAPLEWGYQAINIHWGGEYGTSSWGCQTAPPVQWSAFQKKSYKLTGEQLFLPYILLDNWEI